jgi:hypothetical protein
MTPQQIIQEEARLWNAYEVTRDALGYDHADTRLAFALYNEMLKHLIAAI